MPEQLFLDTVYIQALLNRNDQYHEKDKQLSLRVRAASRVLITEAVLLEIGNALSPVEHRKTAVTFFNGCYNNVNTSLQVIPVDGALLRRSLRLFESRPDKNWSLTDSI
jgi:predicted nucleic acid-binding protein